MSNVDMVWMFMLDYPLGWGSHNHSHDYFQIFFILKGSSEMIIAGEKISLHRWGSSTPSIGLSPRGFRSHKAGLSMSAAAISINFCRKRHRKSIDKRAAKCDTIIAVEP